MASLLVRRRRPGGLQLAAAVACAAVGVSALRLPYLSLRAGPTEDVVHLITIRGARTHPVRGRLLLTTVSLTPVRVYQAVRGWFDSSYEVIPRSSFVPPGESEEDVARQTALQMHESQLFATAAALRYLGYPVRTGSAGVRVDNVEHGVPAAQALRPGDVVVAIDGHVVKSAGDFRAAVRSHRPGDEVGLRVVRAGRTIEVRTRTVPRTRGSAEAMVGVVIGDLPDVRLPSNPAVHIDALDIGGPSAGLMFALGIVDLLGHVDLAQGRVVAGTGEIDASGRVGPVGGVREKVIGARAAGADLFLVPSAESREACAEAGPVVVVAVDTLSEAVQALAGPAPPSVCR